MITTPTEVDLRKDPQVREATDLLKWALYPFLKEPSMPCPPWPKNLIKPIESPPDDSPQKIADELALLATAGTLLHKLAHHHIPRPEPCDQQERETQADFWAADWILSDFDPSHPAFIKRTLAIAIFLSVITALGIEREQHESPSHPPDYERLIKALERHVTDDNHPAWAFSMAILKLHLDHKQVPVPDIFHNSCRECVGHYAEIIATNETIQT